MRNNRFLKKTLVMALVFTMFAPIMENLKANMKEVHAAEASSSDILSVKCQVTDGVVTETSIDKYRDNYVMRFVSSVDSLNYKEVGFKISYEENGKTVTKTNKTKTVYKSINSTTGTTDNGKDTYTFSPKVISPESKYFITAKLPITPDKAGVEYTVWAFAKTSAGKTIEGAKRRVSVNDGLKTCDTINMSFENNGNQSVNKDDVLAVNGSDTISATVIGVDGTMVHTRISGVDKATLKSATKFSFAKEGNEVGSGIFRNLYTKYAGTADTSWYDVYAAEDSTQTKFTIATNADLYGLATIVDGGNDLSGKEIYVVSDIAANPETLVVDSADANYMQWKKQNGEYVSKPTYTWNPIGGDVSGAAKYFEGTFDGQGHTISGIYLTSSTTKNGLFSQTTETAHIKDLRLEDSYFASSGAYTGSVVGYFSGTIEKIYSNAIIKRTATSGASRFGGIVGTIINGAATVSECWFDGQIDAYQYVGGITGCIEAGNSSDVLIQHCLYSGDIKSYSEAGGISGYMLSANDATITDCLSMGTASYNSSKTGTIGSFVGYIADNVTLEKSVGNKAFYGNRYGNNNSYVTLANDCVTKDQSSCIGTAGSALNTYLDFENHWVVKLNGTPVLQSLSDGFFKSQWTDKDDKAVYEIDNADEFYEFALVSQTKSFSNCIVKLGADIVLNTGTATAEGWTGNDSPVNWTPIGNATKPFAGTFDGQGHTVSGVYLLDNTYESGLGLFSKTTANAKIEDFRLENSYFESDSPYLGAVVGSFAGTAEKIYSNAIVRHTGARSRVGGIAGTVQGGVATISECWYDGKVLAGSAAYVGGITGGIEAGNSSDVLIEHSLFTGHVSAKKEAGGIVGYMLSGNNVEIVDSLSVGTASYSDNPVGSLVGFVGDDITIRDSVGNKAFKGNRCGPSNTGAINMDNVSAAIDNNNYVGAQAKGLNVYIDFANLWVPQPNGTPVLKYFTSEFYKDGVFGENNDLIYTIESEGEFYEFAAISQTEDFANCIVKLDTDITLNAGAATENGWSENANPKKWTPIGNATKPFAGIFDGQGHTISGVYLVDNTYESGLGLFSKTTANAMIKDFRLENSYFESDSPYLGAVVGSFAGTAEKIYSNAIVRHTGARSRIGGIAGTVQGGVATISECWYEGKVFAGNAAYVGGIAGGIEAGNSSDVLIEHCSFTGHVSAKKEAGGIVGYMLSGNNVEIADSLSVGTASYSDNPVGSLVGFVGGDITIRDSVGNKAFKGNRCGPSNTGAINMDNVSAAIDNANCIGNKGLSLDTYLDFESMWVLHPTKTPMLKYFTTGLFKNFSIENTRVTYTIQSIEDFYEFAEMTQSVSFADYTMKLGEDITVNEGIATENGWSENANPKNWTPIGNATTPFAGTFDGQGHTISGVYLVDNTYESGLGLFSKTTANAKIEDFRLENSYFESDSPYLGAVVGSFAGTAEKIYSNAIVRHTGARSRIGGIAGTVQGGVATISECWYEGKVLAGNAAYVGGIAGGIEAGNSSDVLIEHCLFTGHVSAKKEAGGIVGYMLSGNNVEIADSLSVGTASYSDNPVGSLVGFVGDDITIRDSVGNKAFKGNRCGPSNTGAINLDNVSAAIDNANCIGEKALDLDTYLEFEDYWAVRENDVPVLLYFSEGFQGDYVIEDGKKVYTIDNKEELYEFVEISQLRSFTNCIVKLGADITVNEGTASEIEFKTTSGQEPEKWTPIGKSKAFAGTFDGQGYTISGVYGEAGSGYGYMGLFASTSGTSVVQNLKLKNSYFNVMDINRVGSIAGSGAGKFYNLYSDAIVISNNQWFGGIVGFATNTELERCWFDGTVISTTNNVNHMGKGGLIGIQYGGTASIKNCLNTGVVDVSAFNAVASGSTNVSPRAGGLVGYVTSGGTMAIDSSLNIGEIKLHKDVNHGYGRLVGHKSADCSVMISNSYATTNKWTGDDPIQTTVSYEIVSEDSIKGVAAKTAMPLLDWSVWACGENENDYPSIRFSEENLGVKANYGATESDKILLNSIYQNLVLAYGDMHAHAEEDTANLRFNTTNEQNAFKTWKNEMTEHGLDFVASLDHHQTNHILNDEWDTNKFIYGTEPSTYITMDNGKTGEMHYNMLFAAESKEAAKTKLDNVLNAFSGKFNSVTYKLADSKYAYANFTKSEFKTLIEKVKSEGGLFVIPHPNLETALLSDDWRDFDFGVDRVGFEVVARSLSGEETQLSYKYWKELLLSGRKYFVCAGSDIHGSLNEAGLDSYGNALAQKAITSVYASAKNSQAYFEQFKAGNYTAGSVGIQMCIGDESDITAMGGECDFAGKRLVVKIGQLHQSVYAEGRKYHVDIITDQGVVYSQSLGLTENGTENLVIAFDTKEEYKFYRVEVIDENGAVRIGYGNPIWNTNVVAK